MSNKLRENYKEMGDISIKEIRDLFYWDDEKDVYYIMADDLQYLMRYISDCNIKYSLLESVLKESTKKGYYSK
jgi:hypothetical protein